MKYKKGQWLARTTYSPYFTKGKYYKICGVYRNGILSISDDCCENVKYHESEISEHFNPAPKTWETLEVGDVLIDQFGGERAVVEVLDNCFAYSYKVNTELLCDWLTFKHAKSYSWKIKRAEDTEVEEMTMEEVCKELGRTIKIKK